MLLQPEIGLLDRVRQPIRLKNYTHSTEKAYVYWSKLRRDPSLPTPNNQPNAKISTFFVYTTRAWHHLLIEQSVTHVLRIYITQSIGDTEFKLAPKGENDWRVSREFYAAKT